LLRGLILPAARWIPFGAILPEDQPMSPSLSELLKLPAGERAEIAMALWESLSNTERGAELELTLEQAEELDRRWAEHVQRPQSAIPWDDVRRRLLEREEDDGPEPGASYSTKACR
jgi:putative addiction module component (TIGR02574 family)